MLAHAKWSYLTCSVYDRDGRFYRPTCLKQMFFFTQIKVDSFDLETMLSSLWEQALLCKFDKRLTGFCPLTNYKDWFYHLSRRHHDKGDAFQSVTVRLFSQPVISLSHSCPVLKLQRLSSPLARAHCLRGLHWLFATPVEWVQELLDDQDVCLCFLHNWFEKH